MYPKDLFPSQLLFHIKPYYISIFTYRKQPVFQDKYACELLLNVLTYNKYALDYLVYAFVIMPDHLHIVFHPCKVPISQVVRKNMGNFTRYYQKYTGRNQPVWEQDYLRITGKGLSRPAKNTRAYTYQSPAKWPGKRDRHILLFKLPLL